MIRLRGVGKRFPGQDRPAVDDVDLDVPDGRTCVLIGPSGCGKTTTLRMVNRLIEPTSGTIEVEGDDVTKADPVRLRRRIGYVIQGVGLFPHLSVGDNVATVPRLLGWPTGRVDARIDEMLALVGLEPGTFRHRRPASLSGGQRQRVGVARALAADPPVMLMDEPFGAVDPVVRARLQREFSAILRRLGKTVIMVTHDIDEAIRMGDLVAVMRDGHVAQAAPPAELLLTPSDAFVAEFVGADRALKRLSLIRAADVAQPRATTSGLPVVAAEATLQAALSALLAAGTDAVAIADQDGHVNAAVSLHQIRAQAASPDVAHAAGAPQGIS